MALSTPVAAATVTIVATVAAALAAAVALARLSEDASVPERTSAKRIVVVTANVTAILGTVALGVWEPFVAALSPGRAAPDPGLAILGGFVLATALAVPGVVLAQLVPAIHRARSDPDRSPTALLRAAAWNALGTAAFVLLGTVAVVAMALAPHPAISIAVPPALGLLGAQLRSIAAARAVPTRDPTAAERERIEAALEQSDGSADRIHVAVDRPEVGFHRPFSTGHGPFSHVYVPETTFETMDEQTLETTLVTIATPSGFGVFRILAHGLLLGLFLTAVLSFDAVALFTEGSFDVHLAGSVLAALGVALVAPSIGRRLVFRSDRRAAAAVGTATLVESFERQFELAGGEEIDRLTQFVLFVPTVEARIANLQSSGGEAAGTTPAE